MTEGFRRLFEWARPIVPGDAKPIGLLNNPPLSGVVRLLDAE